MDAFCSVFNMGGQILMVSRPLPAAFLSIRCFESLLKPFMRLIMFSLVWLKRVSAFCSECIGEFDDF